ncbi:hypothetical protein TRIUR3_35362 [Triticum urartu]|uniref:Uncharacterized protein n=1 Tax=Triticum urartu TaxID=4572 RepID=M8AY71_TRIUA|nr:hypothetical protein TRIUR3_35362 [Triticum urartu]
MDLKKELIFLLILTVYQKSGMVQKRPRLRIHTEWTRNKSALGIHLLSNLYTLLQLDLTKERELSSTHNAANDGIEDNVAKEDEHLELPRNGRAKDCAGAEEQVAEVIVRKGCLKHPGADASSGSSSAAKKVRFVLVEQAEAEMVGFRRPRVTWSPVVAKTRGRQKARVTLAGAKSSGGERRRTSVDGDSDGEGADAGGAGSDAQLRLFKRNVGNFGTGDGVEKVAGAASRNTTSKADMEDGDVETVDRKRKASENTEDIGKKEKADKGRNGQTVDD